MISLDTTPKFPLQETFLIRFFLLGYLYVFFIIIFFFITSQFYINYCKIAEKISKTFFYLMVLYLVEWYYF